MHGFAQKTVPAVERRVSSVLQARFIEDYTAIGPPLLAVMWRRE